MQKYEKTPKKIRSSYIHSALDPHHTRLRMSAPISMLPPGPLLLLADDPVAHERLRSTLVCSSMPHEVDLLGEGRITVGCVHPGAAAPRARRSTNHAGATMGIFDGFTFDGSMLEQEPHRMLDMTDEEVCRSANGMFLALAVDGLRHSVRVLTDPWATLPIYHAEQHGSMMISTSIALIRSVLRIADDDFCEDGIAQMLAYGKIIDGSTLFRSVRRIGRARVVDASWIAKKITITERKYHALVVAPDEYAGIEDDVTTAFAEAMRCIVGHTDGRVLCTLSGGFDSRVIAAAAAAGGLPVLLATQYSLAGSDALVAREISSALQLQHEEIVFPQRLEMDRIPAYVRMTNGMVSLASYHMMWAYPDYARHCEVMIDGAHTWIEGRWFLRNTAHRIRSKDDFFLQTRAMLAQNATLSFARAPERLAARADEILRALLPDPRDFASSICAADTFNAEVLMPAHHVDLALLQSHWCRFASPYYDLRYTSLISRISERRRWRQDPQLWMMRAFAPRVAGMARSYADVRTLATANPLLSRIPVAIDRGLGLLARMTGVRRYTLAQPSCAWRLEYDASFRIDAVPEFLDAEVVQRALRRAMEMPAGRTPYSAGDGDPLMPIMHLGLDFGVPDRKFCK